MHPPAARPLDRFNAAVFPGGRAKAQGQVQEMMVDTPAIVSADFVTGRCMLISPHPESDQHLWGLVEQSLRWAARQDSTAASPQAVTRSAEQDRKRCQDEF